MKRSSIGYKYSEEMISAIGENLSALRKLCGGTIEKIATGAGLSTTTLYKLEKGKDKNVSIWKLFDLCSFIKLTLQLF